MKKYITLLLIGFLFLCSFGCKREEKKITFAKMAEIIFSDIESGFITDWNRDIHHDLTPEELTVIKESIKNGSHLMEYQPSLPSVDENGNLMIVLQKKKIDINMVYESKTNLFYISQVDIYGSEKAKHLTDSKWIESHLENSYKFSPDTKFQELLKKAEILN
jgi:hypothetical protein